LLEEKKFPTPMIPDNLTCPIGRARLEEEGMDPVKFLLKSTPYNLKEDSKVSSMGGGIGAGRTDVDTERAA
jgi:hypothetical protein